MWGWNREVCDGQNGVSGLWLEGSLSLTYISVSLSDTTPSLRLLVFYSIHHSLLTQ